MSDLSKIERLKLEKMLDMGGGYVLDFSNRTFEEFILESTRLEIYSDKYDFWSGSKANRLRAFWDKEPNYLVGKLTKDLLEYWKTNNLLNGNEVSKPEQDLYEECLKIVDRLNQDVPVEQFEVLQPNVDDKDFNMLSKSIRESIINNEPESALDRLHTFVVKYVRQLCLDHGLQVDKEKPLHSIFGEYVKFLKSNELIDSNMTERILKSSISILDAFNSVRNTQSFAHDNPILNYNESILIFNNVSSSIRFIESVEQKIADTRKQNEIDTNWDDLPF
ncbi:abortive infection family protein [Draconibacterium sediminis]|uniref:abortive infection family protein n=1 Tax=Draconibacterium sediminis TaxID=1544798 RepID=UPI0026F1B932|nr:abortive infection family protein [Draconibacterium sediminis]